MSLTAAAQPTAAPADDGRCRCDAPQLDPSDDEEFCWGCRRFVHDPEEDPEREAEA